MDKVNLDEKFALVRDYWSPKIVGDLNDSYIKVVKMKGEFVWHHHAAEDEMFSVVKGVMRIAFRARPGPGTRPLARCPRPPWPRRHTPSSRATRRGSIAELAGPSPSSAAGRRAQRCGSRRARISSHPGGRPRFPRAH